MGGFGRTAVSLVVARISDRRAWSSQRLMESVYQQNMAHNGTMPTVIAPTAWNLMFPSASGRFPFSPVCIGEVT